MTSREEGLRAGGERRERARLERGPGLLHGWRILLGRPHGRGGALISLLDALGATAQAIPFIEVGPVADSAQMDGLVMALSEGNAEWVVFTSVNAVDAVLSRANTLRLEQPVSASIKVAAVGPVTADHLKSKRIPVDLVPPGGGSARDLVDIFPQAGWSQLALLPRSALADDVLPDGLRAKGYDVQCADAYLTTPRLIPPSVAEDLKAGNYEAVLVTSTSAVPVIAAAEPAPSTLMIAIGRSTAAALVEAGFHRIIVTPVPNDLGVIRALQDHLMPPEPDTGTSPPPEGTHTT